MTALITLIISDALIAYVFFLIGREWDKPTRAEEYTIEPIREGDE